MQARGYQPDGPVVQARASAAGGTLSVQKGICAGTATGGCQIAFIYLNDRFLGTDTANPSAAILAIEPATVGRFTITYANYAAGDPGCCPSLPPVTVVYTWNGTRLTPDVTPPGH